MLQVDKYRPKTLAKVLVHEDIAQNLKKLVSEQDCPHLLFYGPPGSGKKTLIMLLLREMFGASAEMVKVENKTWKVDEPPALVIDSNGAVTGHIISTTIGGENGEPKQVDVNDPFTAPIYQFLKSSSGGFLGNLIKWNFEKFLVEKNGKVVERYMPMSPFQIEDTQKLLAA